MKKYLFALLFITVPSMMKAQLSVLSNGNVFIKNGSINSNANLTISNAPYLGFVSDNLNASTGTRSQGYTTSNNSSIGVIGEGYIQNSNGASIGVWGEGYGASSKNFGVVGMLDIYSSGAGIYATTEGNLNYFNSGTYAGYFVGPTYVDGSLTCYSFYNLSDMRLKENVISLNSAAKGQSPLSKLQNLEVIEYNLKRPNTNQVSDRRHYGVSAQELQEIYPDLVLQGQDGYLTVNYVELVPLLLRSIQELKQELDEIRAYSDTGNKTRSAGYETSSENTLFHDNILYQNTPNPFQGKTTIRYKLTDDIQNANITIFDMSGKMLKKFPISSGEGCVSVYSNELCEGMFLYSLIVNGQEVDTKKMIMSK